MVGPKLEIALEMICNPDDLIFIIAGGEPFVLRGPEGNFSIVALPKDFKMMEGEDPVDLIKSQLYAAVGTVERELRNGGSFQELLNPKEDPLEDVVVMKDKDIERIIEGLRKYKFYETYNGKLKY